MCTNPGGPCQGLHSGTGHQDAGSALAIKCSTQHFEFVEAYSYSYPGSVGGPLTIVLNWSGSLPGGDANNGPQQTEETVGPGSRGTHPASLQDDPPWSDTATIGLRGIGLVYFNLSWQTGLGAASQKFYYACS